ncbi:major capsid protein [Acinetobacter sp. c3-l95]|uniref:major capsid protein n=1 Tax=Acinetobacter sp. c3-l95 TaxID=3342804 RepID=UPI0035B8D6E6
MPLSSEQNFGVRALTTAINNLPTNPTVIRELGIFSPEYLSTTYVNVEQRDGVLTLVQAKNRGSRGDAVTEKRHTSKNFNILHLPMDDVVLADDVQNLRSFGSDNTVETVASKVNDKLESMKSSLEYSREHLMLGALQGKIINADGTTLVDIYNEFGLKRTVHTLALSKDVTNVQAELDKIIIAQRKALGGEIHKGQIALVGADFLQALVYHNSIKDVYLRFQEAMLYRDENTAVSFEHKGIKFVLYDYEFAGGTKIASDEGILLPAGTKNTFREYFAPADMNATVNTKALPYYAVREKLPNDKGWSLHAQSNPLPLVLRPNAVATLKMS